MTETITQGTRTLTLTTEHPASSHGIPVAVVDGQAYGPADIIWESRAAELLSPFGGNKVQLYDTVAYADCFDRAPDPVEVSPAALAAIRAFRAALPPTPPADNRLPPCPKCGDRHSDLFDPCS